MLITHKLGEEFGAADRVTVLRRGVVVVPGEPLREHTPGSLAVAMIGSAEPPEREIRRPVVSGPAAIRLPGVEVRGGELVGIAAVEGNGQRELLRSLVGLGSRPADFEVRPPVAFIPEDRTTEGIVPGFTLTENLVLGLPEDARWVR